MTFKFNAYNYSFSRERSERKIRGKMAENFTMQCYSCKCYFHTYDVHLFFFLPSLKHTKKE